MGCKGSDFLKKNQKVLDDMICAEAQTGSKKTVNLKQEFENASDLLEQALKNPSKTIEVKDGNETKLMTLKELKVLKLWAKDALQHHIKNFWYFFFFKIKTLSSPKGKSKDKVERLKLCC